MSYSIAGTSITLTRGDTFYATVTICYPDGTIYEPQEGDMIRFAMKERYSDYVPLLVKDIPIDTMQLILNPEDTEKFDFGRYVYDVELTKADGTVDTFITKATIRLAEEVD